MVGECEHPSGDAGPLDGVTVLDASWALAGPFCTMQLGDLGADVVKIERPDGGDQTRGWRPPSFGDESAYFVSVNRNKRSVTLDLRTDEGQTIFRHLAEEADIVVENFSVGTMEDWGIGYPDLKTDHPGLIYTKISGYGEWGPDRDRRAYDIILQAEGGMMSVTGVEDGPPVRVGVAIADICAGHYATQAILAALVKRGIDGTGQKVDVSLLDGQAAWMTYLASFYFATGESPGRLGSQHPTIAPYQAFEAADGYVVIAVGTEALWGRFVDAIDRPELASDPHFETNADRVEHRDELAGMLQETFEDQPVDEIVDLLDEHDVPASPLLSMEEVFDHPQVAARGMLQTLSHPSIGEVSMPGSPMHLSDTPTSMDRAAPLLGEHTAEVLYEYGFTEDEIARFQEDEVV